MSDVTGSGLGSVQLKLPAGRAGLEVGERDGTCVSMEMGLPLATVIPDDGEAAVILSAQLML